MKLRDSGFEPLSNAVRPTLAIPQHQAGKCARRGTEACRNSCAYYIGRISRKQALSRPPPHLHRDVRRQDAECRSASRLADGYRMRVRPCRRNRYRVRVRSGRGYREAVGVLTSPRGAEAVRMIAIC